MRFMVCLVDPHEDGVGFWTVNVEDIDMPGLPDTSIPNYGFYKGQFDSKQEAIDYIINSLGGEVGTVID